VYAWDQTIICQIDYSLKIVECQAKGNVIDMTRMPGIVAVIGAENAPVTADIGNADGEPPGWIGYDGFAAALPLVAFFILVQK
jgi:hypothetical protein